MPPRLLRWAVRVGLVIIICSASVLALTVWRGLEYLQRGRTLKSLSSGTSETSAETQPVAGHKAHGGWHFIATQSDSGHHVERYERWTYRYTVQGLLPSWLLMNWSASRSVQNRGTQDFLPLALFGSELTERVPENWTIFTEVGDLVVQSEEAYRLQVPREPLEAAHQLGRDLALAFLRRGMQGFEVELKNQALMGGQAEALRVYCRHFVTAPQSDPWLQQALHHELAAVRVVAAQHLGSGGRDALLQGALDRALPTRVRREAALALVQHHDHAATLQIAAEAPTDLEDILAPGLVHAPGDVEHLLLPMLEHPSDVVVEAAVHALAQRGRGSAVPRLKARRSRRASRELRVAIEVAIELIQDRGRAADAGLALLPDPRLSPEVGRVSVKEPPPCPHSEG